MPARAHPPADADAPAGAEPAGAQHAPHNAMLDPGEIERFYDRCSDLMRALLDELARHPDRARPFPEIEDALGWPRRRIASVLGGVWRLRQTEFGGRRPYRFHDARDSASRRWEIWMDAAQARAARTAAHDAARQPARGRSDDSYFHTLT